METEEVTIKIYQNSDGDYNYDVYDTNDVDDDTQSVDGGTCTSTMANAIGMATDCALKMINAENPNEKLYTELPGMLERFIDSCGLDQIDASNQAQALLNTLNDIID